MITRVLKGNGRLPLDGVIPDMTATTELYLEMQRIYQAQAAADREAVSLSPLPSLHIRCRRIFFHGYDVSLLFLLDFLHSHVCSP